MSYFREITREQKGHLIKSPWLLFLLLIIACGQPPLQVKIPEVEVNKKLLLLNPQEGKWYYENKPFTGYAVTRYENNQLEEKTGFYKGKKEGMAEKRFENGKLHKQSFYLANHLHGNSKSWWASGSLSEESNYLDGVTTGIQVKYHANGKMARRSTIVKGQEEGLQQAWLENGKLYVNYETKNGRIFGLKRSNTCYTLENEKIKRK